MRTPFNEDSSKAKILSQEQIAEIRNALAIILGNAQLLERDPEITQEQRKKLEVIGNQTHRIAKILEEGESQGCYKDEPHNERR